MPSIFLGWRHLAKFRRLRKQIRQFNRQNKKQRLEEFLKEGADLALHNQTYDWFRRVRKLCPKQRPQKIQIFDKEFKQIQDYLDKFYHYLTCRPPHISPLNQPPIATVDGPNTQTHVSITVANP